MIAISRIFGPTKPADTAANLPVVEEPPAPARARRASMLDRLRRIPGGVVAAGTRTATAVATVTQRAAGLMRPSPRPPKSSPDKPPSVRRTLVDNILGPRSVAASGEPQRRGAGFWFPVTVLIFIAGLAAIDAALFIQGLYERSALLGTAFATLAAAMLACAAWWTADEIGALQRLKDSESRRARATALIAAGANGGAGDFVKDLRQALADRPDIAGSFSKLDETLRAPCTDREALQHLAREVLRPLDERASGVVGRIARQTSFGVAANPVALLDAALVLWRSARMVREIAEIYGFRPGLVATSRLARRALSGAASAALIDTVGDIWGAQLTGRVAAAVSPKLAEGVFAAIRMARFGIAVIELCRPVPFLDSDEKPLSRLRGQVAGWMR